MATAEAAYRVVGEHRPLGVPGGAAGGHHQGVAVGDRGAAGPAGRPVGADDHGGGQGVEERPAGRGRQAAVDREHRVAVFPRGAQGVDPRGAGGEVDCDQTGHGR